MNYAIFILTIPIHTNFSDLHICNLYLNLLYLKVIFLQIEEYLLINFNIVFTIFLFCYLNLTIIRLFFRVGCVCVCVGGGVIDYILNNTVGFQIVAVFTVAHLR